MFFKELARLAGVEAGPGASDDWAVLLFSKMDYVATELNVIRSQCQEVRILNALTGGSLRGKSLALWPS